MSGDQDGKQTVLNHLASTNWLSRKTMTHEELKMEEPKFLKAMISLVKWKLIKTSSRPKWYGQWWITKKGEKVREELTQTFE